MTRIYLDPTALVLAAPDGTQPDGVMDHAAPGARDAVGRLVDGGFEVIVLDTGAPFGDLPGGVLHATELPEHLEADAWYLTGEPHPQFGRPRGGTTVLVGPRRPVGKVPLPRFDLEARDMASAVMEILTRQAMA